MRLGKSAELVVFILLILIMAIGGGCNLGDDDDDDGGVPVPEDDDDDAVSDDDDNNLPDDDDSADDDDSTPDDDDASDDDDSQDDDDDDSDDDDNDDDDDVPYQAPDGFEVTFIDVGQGDAALLRFPGGSTVLVDGGPNWAGNDDILPYFEDMNLIHLDLIVVSHPHSDHIGGLDEVIKKVEVDEIWENGEPKDSQAYDDFSDAADDYDIDRRDVAKGYSCTIDGCYIDVLSAAEVNGDENSKSIVMTIECEDIILLMTGDATEETQEYLIDLYGYDLSSDIVKIPHHGSPDRDYNFPDYVTPEFAVVSCGEDNPYGHPDSDAMEEWEDAGAVTYRTDQDGNVVILAQDGYMSVSTEY